jgi:hypothetical protein
MNEYFTRAFIAFSVGYAVGDAFIYRPSVACRLAAIEEIVMSTSAGIAELEKRLDDLSSGPDNPSPERED